MLNLRFQASLLITALSLSLSSCAQITAVAGGDDNVTFKYDPFMSEAKGDVMKEAKAYCASRGKGKVIFQGEDQEGLLPGGWRYARFKCIEG